MFVYACIQYVYARICMYVQVCIIKYAQAEECNGLIDDGVSSHVLADDSGIAAQINWQERNVSAGMPLAGCISYLHVFFVNNTGILANTDKYIQIHTYTCKYMHSRLAISAKVGSQARYVWAGNCRKEQASQVSQSRWPSGRATGPWGDKHLMQSVPGHIAEGDSQAQVQVEPLVDKGQPVSQSRFTRGTGSGTGS